MNTEVRRTSIYSLRFYPPSTYPAASALDDLTRAMGQLDVLRLDSHVRTEDGQTYAAVGFRAGGDGSARSVATTLLRRAGLDESRAQLFTGFGSHRRQVAR